MYWFTQYQNNRWQICYGLSTNRFYTKWFNKLFKLAFLKTPFKMNNSNNKNAKEYEKELEDYLNYNNKIRYLKWKGVRVGVKRTFGKISTIFPNRNQSTKRRK